MKKREVMLIWVIIYLTNHIDSGMIESWNRNLKHCKKRLFTSRIR
jgi:hypothetical protein